MPDAVRLTQPFVDINAFKGISTKQNPETLDPVYLFNAKNVDFFRIYGAISKVKGNRRVLTSAYIESGTPSKIGWVGFYKFPDPNGAILRDTLAACGTTMRKLSGGGTVELTTGLKEGLVRTSDKLDRYMFITGQDQFSVGNKDKMMIYDGEIIRDWGLKAPGEKETIREDFNDSNSFTVNASSAVLTNESSITWDGDSIKVTTNGANAIFSKTYSAFPVSTAAANRLKFYVYIPRNEYTHLSVGDGATSALTITFSSTNAIPVASNYYRYYFPIDMLSEGWNELFCDFSIAPSGTIGTSSPTLDPANIRAIEYKIQRNGSTDATLYFDNLITLEAGTPTLTAVAPDSSAVYHWAKNDEFPSISVFTPGIVCNTAADFNILDSGTNTIAAITGDSNGFYPSSAPASIQFNKLYSLRDHITIDTTNDMTPIDLEAGYDDACSLWLYIPDATKLRAYAGNPANYALRFFVSSASADSNYNGTAVPAYGTAYAHWDKFYGADFVSGWNHFILPKSEATVGGTFNWNAVIRFCVAIHLNGSGVLMPDLRLGAFGIQPSDKAQSNVAFFQEESGLVTLPDGQNVLEVNSVDYTGWDDAVTSGGLNQKVLRIDKIVPVRSNSVEVLTFPSPAFSIIPNANAPTKTLFYIYFPVTEDLITTYPIELTLYGTYTTGIFSRWLIPFSILTSGWNILEIDLENPSATGGGGITNFFTDTIDAVKLKLTFTNTTEQRGIRLLGFASQQSDAALTGGGIYSYRITYETKDGLESNAGPVSASIQMATGGQNISLNLTGTASADPAVTKKNIYRTAGSGGVWLYLTTIPNSQASYTDSTPDGSLGTSVPPFSGDTTIDNTPPPSAHIVKVWKRTVFLAGDPLAPHVLYFSRVDNPYAFPILNAFELDSRITGIYESYLGLVITTENDHWRVVGDNPDYIVEKVIHGIGAVGPRAVGAIRLDGWAVDRDGLRLYDLRNMNPISEPIRDKYYSLNKTYIERTHTVHFRKMNTLLQFNPDANGRYSSVFMYQYESDDARSGAWSELELPSYLNLLHLTEVEDDDGEWHLYAGSDDGMIYELFDQNSDNWTNVDGYETAIQMEFQTHYMRLGALGQDTQIGTGRAMPRHMELRVEETRGLAATSYILLETAYGSNKDAFKYGQDNMEFNLPAGVSFYKISPNPQNITAASHIRLKVSNTELDKDLIFYGVRMYLHIYPDQRNVESANAF